MSRSQLNIKLPERTLKRIKRQAMMKGKTLTQHLVDLINRSLEDEILEDDNLLINDATIHGVLHRLLRVESAIQNYSYLNTGLTPFSDQEAINCSEFMREVFVRTVKEKGFSSNLEAFSDFSQYLQDYENWNEASTMRLREVMLMENPEPWTGNELNDLSSGDKCNCPIRFGLIEWTGKYNIPSQQEICDKGAELLNRI